MVTNKTSLMVAAMGVALIGARVASADTITVQNETQSIVTDVNVSDGADFGKQFTQFTYKVTFDSGAYIENGDGFVLYDWAGLVDDGSSLNPSFDETNPPIGNTPNDFDQINHLTVQNSGNALGLTILNSHTPSGVAAGAAQQAAQNNDITFDAPNIENLSFVWSGPPNYIAANSGQAIAILTLYSTIVVPLNPTNPFLTPWGSADNSGGADNGQVYSQAGGTIIAPNYAPLPLAWMGGSALFGLVGAGRLRRNRREA